MEHVIDTDALLANIKRNAPFVYSIVAPIVAITPTLDVAPVVHGKWGEPRIIGFDDSYRAVYGYPCSVCNDCTEVIDANYCPNCGAKMDGEAE